MKIDPNAPAFPGIQGESSGGNSTASYGPHGDLYWITHNQGLPIRAHIATELLAGMAHHTMSPDMVKQAVSMADLLIEELNKS